MINLTIVLLTTTLYFGSLLSKTNMNQRGVKKHRSHISPLNINKEM